MADESTASKLKSKSKWGKLLSKDKTGGSGNFKLNEDVVDFLKPSTEKYSSDLSTQQWSSAPRVDVAIAQRWPGPGDVKRAMSHDTEQALALQTRPNGRPGPKKGKNLTVAFAKTVPDIIGEGGDEAETPVIEVSRMKAKTMRSFSERRPPTGDGPSTNPPSRGAEQQPLSAPPKDPYARPDVHRAKTSVGENSYHIQHKPVQQEPKPLYISTALESEPRPGLLKRAPTGFSVYESDDVPETPDEPLPAMPSLPALPSLPPQIPMNFAFENAPVHHQRGLSSSSSSPPDPVATLTNLFVEKATSRMNAEGRTFRRVSRQESNPEDLAELRSLSSVEVDSPPRAPPHHIAMRSSQDYGHSSERRPVPNMYSTSSVADRQHVPENYHAPQQHQPSERQYMPEQYHEPERHAAPEQYHQPERHAALARRPDASIPTSPDSDADRADSMRPRASPSQGLLSHSQAPQVQYSESTSSTPPRFDQTNIPRIDTSFSSPIQAAETTISPETHKSLSAMFSSISSTVSPNALKLPSPNYSRPGHYQTNQFQGITPSPNREPTSSYFSSHSAQTLSPQAASPAPSSYDPHSRPASQNSHYTPFSPVESHADSPESAAYADFDSRVAHMRGVFRLTAEREHPTSAITLRQWLRCAMWWLHRGRAGLGALVKNITLGPDGQKRELLTQPHVDVAKAWWILTDMLEDAASPQLGSPPGQHDLKRQVELLRLHLSSLALSMQRNDVMPPHQSLIQGQDTTIWLRYPRFAPDAASLLHGPKSGLMEQEHHETDPLEALPAGDNRSAFFYNRMMVDVSVNTDEEETDRVVLPCILTMMRSRADYQPTIIISSQSDLVNICVRPGNGGPGKGPTWNDVSWKTRSHGLYVRLPRGFNLNVELQDNDFRGLLNMIEYTKKLESNFAPQADERLVHEARLVEMQYGDSSNPHAFPKERVRSCTALVFERSITRTEGHGMRKMHRGFRLLLTTNPTNKTLSSVTHELCRGLPFLFENMGNATAGEAPALVIRIQEAKRACKALLIFTGANERQHLYDILNGINLAPHEAFTRQDQLKSISIEPAASNTPGSILPGGGALESLRWDSIRVVNLPTDGGRDPGHTVLSDHLRIIASHESGGITDRLNLGKLERNTAYSPTSH